MLKADSIEERFLMKVDKKGENGCWIWKGAVHIYGYGIFGHNGKMEHAHRISWFFSHGKIPKETNVIHECDNRICVNPNHLKLVIRKNGRLRHRASKLTQKKADDIRKEYFKGNITQMRLAKIYGVSQKKISDVINYKCWNGGQIREFNNASIESSN